ncbi:MAG TPA: response regulator, partial [Polyangia bacterium]
RLLGAMNHDVTVVTNGRLAVEASAANTFDVVLMDVQMPEMDGIEATLQIRARERETGAHLRIIALTANAMAGDASKYLSVGMDGYLVKPVDRERLGQALETVGPDDDFLIVPPHGEPSDSGAVTLDEETAALFLIECPKWLGEMEGALLASDPRALAQAAHKARGALLTLAAAQPAAIAAALETLANGGELEQAAELLPRLEESLRRMSAEMMSAVISTQARPGEGFSAK